MLKSFGFILALYCCWCTLSVCLEEHHQGAFVQTGDELHYFVDPHQWNEGISAHVFIDSTGVGDNRSGESANKRNENSLKTRADDVSDQNAANNRLNFEPPFLQFEIHSLGVPELRKVKVSNPTTYTIRFDAISGSTVHFHCSFFEHKTIEPGSSTTFDVVFLPRQEGHIENTLFVHSSLGTFSYSVSGLGTANPYRLRPFVGARVPLNGTFFSPINVHNPHSTTLKVTEIYTSGGDLHLELPNGSQDAPASIWEIPPFQTQAVMKAKFIGSRERNATAYIRIKTDRQERPALIVPVEVEVVSKPGLYSAQDLLDFGTITSHDQSKWLTLNVYNTLNRTLQITSIEVDVEAVSVNFKPVNLTSDSRTPSCIGKVAFQGNKVHKVESKKSGYVKVKSDDPKLTLTVPYNVQVLHGKLYHEDFEVSFYSNNIHADLHNITIWNEFDTPLAVHTVSLPRRARDNFEIVNFIPSVILTPRRKSFVCQLKFVGGPTTPNNNLQYESRFRLHTNVTKFDIPLHVFNGRLRFTLYSLDQSEFDFGALDAGQERFILFAITNENPIPITIYELTNAIVPHTKLELLGVEDGNHTVLAYDHSPLEYKWKPKIDIPVQFTVEEGTVVSVPEKIILDEAFPGKISSHALQVFSTFPRDMPVLRLSTLSHDPRFVFESFDANQMPMIKHGEISHLGRIYFLPLATCLDDCYVNLPLDTEDGKRWIQGMRLPPNLPEIDAELYQKLREKWNKILANREHIVNGTIMVDSTEVKGFAIPMEGRLTWPRLLKNPSVHFPLTAVGNYTIVNLSLQNPSSFPVAVQMLPLTIYPNPEDLLKYFKNEFQSPLTNFVEMDDVLMFSLRDSELYNARRESPVPKFRQELEQALNIQIPRFTLSLLLQPGMKVRIRLGFLPSDYEQRSSLLLIRNNLTVLETVTLYGRGAKMELRIGSRMPNSAQPLMFEIQEKHLKECENIKRLQHKLPTSLTVRRSFVARNTGELSVTVGNITINGMQCQNRGFRVLNCESFKLKPNETHVIEIAFTPDFTLSWYEASLQLLLVGMHVPMVYTLGASIPREWLPKCQAAMPRPYWEPLMYYTCVTALGFLLICLIATAYLEGDRIITCSLRKQMLAQERRFFDLNDFASYAQQQPLDDKDNNNVKSPVNQKDKAPVDTSGKSGFGTVPTTPTPSTSAIPSGAGNHHDHGSLPKRLILLLYSLITKRKLTRLSDLDAPPAPVASSGGNVTQAKPVHASLGGRKSSEDSAIQDAALSKHRKSSTNNNAAAAVVIGGGGMSTNLQITNNSHYGRKTPLQQQQFVQQKTVVDEQGSKLQQQQQQQQSANLHNINNHNMATANVLSVSAKKSGSKWSNRQQQQQQHNATKSNRKSATPQLDDSVKSDGRDLGKTSPPIVDSFVQNSSDYETSSKKSSKSIDNRSDLENYANKSPHELSCNESEREDSNKSQQQQQSLKSAFTPVKPVAVYKTSAQQQQQQQQQQPASATSANVIKPSATKLGQQQQQQKKKSSLQQASSDKIVKPYVSKRKADDRFSKPDRLELPMSLSSEQNNSGREVASESEESNVPEWETSSLPPDAQNIDEAFDLLAAETENFSTLIDGSISNANQQQSGKAKANNFNAEKSSKSRHSISNSSSSATSSNKGGKESNNLSFSASLSCSSSSLEASSSSSPSPEQNLAPPAHHGARKKKPVAMMTAAHVPSSASPMGRSKVSPTHSRVKKRSSASVTSNVGVIGAKPSLPVQPASSYLVVPPPNSPFSYPRGVATTGVRHPSVRSAPKPGTDVNVGRNSIMHELREERLRRLHEYQKQKRDAGEEWPGFDLSPVVENLWDEEFLPWKNALNNPPVVSDLRSDIWSSTSATDSVWSTRTGESPIGSTTNLFDLTSNLKFGAGASGWSPNDSAPFGSQSPVQQLRRHSATPVASFGVETTSLCVMTPPPEDSSIVAWAPSISSNNDSKTAMKATYSTDNIWSSNSNVFGGKNSWPDDPKITITPNADSKP